VADTAVEPAAPMAALADEGGLPVSRGSAVSGHAMTFARKYSLPVLLLASFVLYGSWSKTSEVFLSADNLRNMAAGQAVLGVLTLGILLTMVSGHFDLSIGNIAGLSSIITAALFSHQHVPLVVGILAGIAVGTVVGGINGVLVTVLRVDPFIITLGTASIILGYIDWYTHGQSIINGIPTSLVSFGGSNLLGIPKVVYVLGAVALLVYYLMEHTPYGRNLHAIGSNKAAARLVGIRVERTIIVAFASTGAFAGVAGVLLLARTGAGNPQVGTTFTLTAVAAAFLGAASFKVGRLNVPGTIVAIFFLAVNITGLTFAGVENWINQLFTGLTLVLAIALAAVLSKERKTRKAAS
jgi:ribose transport system permease protein